MSLINQMLKDLEQRRAGRAHSNNNFFNNLTATINTHKTMRWLVYAMLAILLIVVLSIIFFSFKSAVHQPLAQPLAKPRVIAKTAAVTPKTAPVIAAVSPLSALVHAVAVTGDKNNSRVSVYLNKPIHYTLSSDPLQNSLVLTLDNCQLAEPLLPLNTHNNLVKSIEVNSVNNQLKINLVVSNGAQVAQIKMDNPPNTVLFLDLNTATDFNHLTTALNTVATINPDSLNNTILAKTGLSDNSNQDTQAYIEKIPQPLTPQQLAVRDYQSAINLIQADRWPEATSLLQQVLAHTPDYTPARTALITLLVKQNRLTEADQTAQAGLNLQPHLPVLIKLAAQILLLQGQPVNALSLLKTAAPPLASDPDYYALMAALYQRLGYSLKAAQIYSQLVSINTNSAIWWLGLGTSLEAAGKNKAALEAYQNANAAGNLSPQLQTYINTRIHALGE